MRDQSGENDEMSERSTSAVPKAPSGFPEARSPSLGLLAKKFFWNTYDHIGKLMVLNFVSVLLILSVVGLPLAAGGMLGLATKIADYQDVSLADFFRAGRAHYRRMACLQALAAFGSLVLFSNFVFYAQNRLGGRVISAVLLSLTLWLSLLFLAWLVYLFPLALRLDLPFRQLARNAVYLVLDNPGFTLWLLVVHAAVWFVSLSTGIGLLFLGIGATAVLQATAVREVLNKYRPGTASREEEVRTFRDLFQPWNT